MLFGRVEQVWRGIATEGHQNTDDTLKCINADEPIVNWHHTWSLSVLRRSYMALVHCRPAVNALQQVDISLPRLSTQICPVPLVHAQNEVEAHIPQPCQVL
jgi:hypothetical protein